VLAARPFSDDEVAVFTGKSCADFVTRCFAARDVDAQRFSCNP
jgi:hypothetical protein